MSAEVKYKTKHQHSWP